MVKGVVCYQEQQKHHVEMHESSGTSTENVGYVAMEKSFTPSSTSRKNNVKNYLQIKTKVLVDRFKHVVEKNERKYCNRENGKEMLSVFEENDKTVEKYTIKLSREKMVEHHCLVP